MNQPLTLLAAQPLLAVHVAGALAAVAIGAVLLWGRQGSGAHRAPGWAWGVGLAGAAAFRLRSFFDTYRADRGTDGGPRGHRTLQKKKT